MAAARRSEAGTPASPHPGGQAPPRRRRARRARLVASLLTAAVALPALVAWTGDGQSYSVERGLVYLRHAGRPLLLDAYLPGGAAGAPHPAIVLVHGGSWSAGDRGYLAVEAGRLAAAGIVALAIDYRVRARPGYPAELDDVEAAVRWTRAHAARLDVDAARVGLLGESAGGNLALLAAMDSVAHPAATAGRVAVVVAWSAPVELARLRRDGAPAWLWAAARRYLGCAPERCGPRYALASPADRVVAGMPPVLLVNSDAEVVPLVQARRLAGELRRAAAHVTLLVLSGSRHALAYADDAWGVTMETLREGFQPPAA